MTYPYKAIIWMAVLLISIGIGSADCPSEDCDKTATNTITEGATITLSATGSSQSQGRPLTYEWHAYKCDDKEIDLYYTSGKLSQPQTGSTLTFYAPAAGDYKVTVTVRDAVSKIADKCTDAYTVCFTTTPGECPTYCCEEICEDVTYPASPSGCPWCMSYTGITANYGFEWLVDGYVYQYGTGDAAKSVCVNWVAPSFVDVPGPTNSNVGGATRTLGIGGHTIELKRWAPNPLTGVLEVVAFPASCDGCTCDPTSLTKCTIYVVDKPVASISGI